MADLTHVALDNLEREVAAQPIPKSEFCAGGLAEMRFHLHVQAPAMIAEIRRHRATMKRLEAYAAALDNCGPEDGGTRTHVAIATELRNRIKGDTK